MAVLRAPLGSIDLISKLGEEEVEEEPDRPSTCATLRQWAAASRFPSAWLDADVQSFAQALGALAIAWGDEFKAQVTPLVLGWVRPMLEPTQLNPRTTAALRALFDAIL